MIPYNQLSLADILQDCRKKFDDDKPAFLKLLQEHVRLDELVPQSFYNHYYAATGRPRDYPLTAMLWALILQRIFSVPSDSLLILMLRYSKHLREFCGFHKIPDATRITRFKQDFISDLSAFFESLVDLTEPICRAIDSAKAGMSIFDSTGIEAYVTENNPKYADSVIRRLKAYAKAQGFDGSYDPYRAAYASMPSCSSASKDIKQLYINGHFCYAYKAGIVTNGLGIVRHIAFYDEDFLNEHKEILVGKKSKSPDEEVCPAGISPSATHGCSYPLCRISSKRIPSSIRKHSSATPLLIRRMFIKNSCPVTPSAKTGISAKPVSRLTNAPASPIPTAPSTNTAFRAAPMTRPCP